jgi:drug/metabolite transporter (DMT)-like permease
MRFTSHRRAILQALLVTFLWSTSWVLIKWNIREIPPLTFAGLRYSIAFLILLPGLRKHKTELLTLSASKWKRLLLLGFVFYTLTQGGQFLTLKYLEAVSFSLLLNFTTLLVAISGIFLLGELPTRLQWFGIFLFIGGVFVYFSPSTIFTNQWFGIVLATLTVCANALASILGRSINRNAQISPLVVTGISMGSGSLILIGMGLLFQGLPAISLAGWVTIIWLAVVNTASAFLLWNKTLQVLTAVESSIINNTMLIQIAILAWVFLGERVSFLGLVGLAVAALGVVFVNLKPT